MHYFFTRFTRAFLQPVIDRCQHLSVFQADRSAITYRCNICGNTETRTLSDLGRETPSCRSCGSTVRWRAIIHLLSTELFSQSLALPEFPLRKELKGLGLSDWPAYADRLAQKLSYTNTYYHQPPRLDIADIDPALENTCDFLIASDVFEHVAPPVSRAFVNAYRLLKPGGVLIFTVPYILEGQTIEHFPDLHHYEIIRQTGRAWLKNITHNNQEQVFDNLVFHGGDGETLEMRVFAEASLKAEFAQAGFHEIRICGDPYFEYGIYWPKKWSMPMVIHKESKNE